VAIKMLRYKSSGISFALITRTNWKRFPLYNCCF